MTLLTWAIARLACLPPAETHLISVERGLHATMSDGVSLVADRYFAAGAPPAPIVLIRTPYNRGAFGIFARIFAERGYQVVLQSVRGTFGSGGTFNAFRDEERDGRATLAWLSEQPWFGGKVAMFGLSYLGLTQWAVAADAPEFVKAFAIQISASSFHDLIYPGNSFGLHGALTWVSLVHEQERPVWQLLLTARRSQRRLDRGLRHLPLRGADRVATGGDQVPYFQDWLVHTAPADEFWAQIDHSRRLERVDVPVNLVAGWYDIFLGRQLADYVALRQAGKQARLTVGPWVHRSPGAVSAGLRETLKWFDAYLLDKPAERVPPVRVFVMGAKRWLDLPDWPPPAVTRDWYVRAAGELSPQPAETEASDSYVYDPGQPTPAVGGPLLSAGRGVYDNRALEARADVLTYTSPTLESDLLVIGDVEAEVFVESSVPHADFFGRLCDVEPSGRSLNVCDGVIRVASGEWPTCVRIGMSATAYLFRRGHQLRLQVSSGAFPRFSRNLGTGEALGEGARFVRAQQRLWHGPVKVSRLRLPVFSTQ